MKVYFRAGDSNGMIEIEDAVKDTPVNVLKEAIYKKTGISRNKDLEVSFEPLLIRINIVENSINAVIEAVSQVKQNYMLQNYKLFDDTSLWNTKYELATKALSGDKEAKAAIEEMITKLDQDRYGKKAATELANKIVAKHNEHQSFLLKLDNILREFRQIQNSTNDGDEITKACEIALEKIANLDPKKDGE